MKMLRRQSGFTLVELMVTMVVFMIVIVAASQLFTSFLGQFKQQSSIAETNIEGIIGLELLRADIEQAGFGLPWDLGGVSYNEAVNDASTFQNDTIYNDAPSNPPRAFVHGDSAGLNLSGPSGTAGSKSDVLVIKATNVATNNAAQKYTYIANTGIANNPPVAWAAASDRLANNDNVIVLNPVLGNSQRILISSGGGFSTTFPPPSAFQPNANSFNTYLIYGINDGSSAPIMPFNRADYYIKVPATNMPTRCATGTGILYKGVISHADGKHTGNELPLLDCVADFQVDFDRDTDNDGTSDTSGPLPTGAAALNAEDTRNQVVGVRVYILAHEGQKDPSFTFNNFTGVKTCATCIRVGEPSDPTLTITRGRDFDLSAIADYQNYRWKVYIMVLKPFNLR